MLTQNWQSFVCVVASVWMLNFAGCGLSPGAGPDASDRVRQVVGDKAVAVLEGATRVEAFRIQGRPIAADDKSERIEGYPLLAKAADLDGTFAPQLSRVLLSDASYAWDFAKGCEPQPGVLFRVWKGNQFASVVLCYECSMLQVIYHAGKDSPDTVHGKWKDFDPSRPALVKLAKQAFPHDKDIQTLAE